MRKAVCSGSFDPVTLGHVDIITRASTMFDEVTVCVFSNVRKQPLFSVEQRMTLLREALSGLPNVKVASFSGLLTDFMAEYGANVIVRGIRSVRDLEYEQNEADLIRHLAPDIDTIFLLTRPEYAYVSSSAIRELVHFHGSVHGLVPAGVERAVDELREKERK